MSVCVVLLLSIYLTHSFVVGTFPYQLDYGEPVVLLMAKLSAQGAPVYQDFQVPPFWTFPYVPIFAWILSIYPCFQAGRLMGSACVLLVLLLTAIAFQRRPNSNWPLFAALFLANPVVLRWTTLCRVDSLALLFAACGILVAQESLTYLHKTPESEPKTSSLRLDIAASILFGLSFFSKQSFIAAPISTALAILVKKPKSGLRFITIQGLVIAVGLLSLRVVYGQSVFKALFENNAVPWQMEQMTSYCGHYLWICAPLMLLSVLEAGPGLYLTYCLCSLFTVIGSGRAGADYNYFLEFHLATCLLVSHQFWQDRSAFAPSALARHRLRTGLVLSQLLVTGSLLQLSDTFYSYLQYLEYECLPVWQGGSPKYISRSRTTGLQMEASLRQIRGPIVAENFGCVLNADAELWMCDPISLTLLGQSGHWNEAALLKGIIQKRVGAVVLQRLDNNPRFSQEFLATVKSNYYPWLVVGKETIYLPAADLPAEP